MPKTQPKRFLLAIDERQLAVILGSLRNTQAGIIAIGPNVDSLDTYYPDIFKDTPGKVTDEEIDSVCENINTAPPPTEVTELVSSIKELMDAEGGEPGDEPEQRKAWLRTLNALEAIKSLTA